MIYLQIKINMHIKQLFICDNICCLHLFTCNKNKKKFNYIISQKYIHYALVQLFKQLEIVFKQIQVRFLFFIDQFYFECYTIF